MTKLVSRLIAACVLAGALAPSAVLARIDGSTSPAQQPRAEDPLGRLVELLLANNDENLGQKFPGTFTRPRDGNAPDGNAPAVVEPAPPGSAQSDPAPSDPGEESRAVDRFVDADTLDGTFRGTILEGVYPDGSSFREAYMENGKLFYVDSSGIVGGDWSVENDTFCTTYEDGNGGCFFVTFEETDCFVFFHTEDGDAAAIGDAWDAVAWRQGETHTCSATTLPDVSSAAPDEGRGKPPAEGSFGSGFVISTREIVTNAHVIEGCRRIEVVGLGEARLVSADIDADLALLEVGERSGQDVAASLHAGDLHLGQQVVMLGYPLSDLLGDALTVNTGIVSSLTGPGGDDALFTVSANVQPGNSGGPVLDMKGRIVGVAVAKLDEVSLLENAGTTGGAIGFAVSGQSLSDFLGPHRDAIGAPGADADMDVESVVAQAQNYTTQIICHHRP